MTYKSTPLTIITIVKNDYEGFVKTFNSVRGQEDKNFEYVVIDASENSLIRNYLEENKSVVNHYEFGLDRGISHAFNKGVQNASGKYVLMLNAGDTLYDACVIKNVSKFLTDGKNLVAGGIFNNQLSRIIDAKKLYYENMPHQALFVGKHVYQQIGTYDELFKLRMDYEFLLRAKKNLVNLCRVDNVISSYAKDGTSAQKTNRYLFYREAFLAERIHQNLPKIDTVMRLLFWGFRRNLS